MKKLIFLGTFLTICAVSSAQTGQPNDDQLQQQTAPPAQRQVERTATNNSVRPQGLNEVQAERESKERGQTQNQTKTQPNGLPPNLRDTINPPKHPNRVIPAKE